MDDLLAVLRDSQGRLDREGVQSIVIGGLAVAVWGEPRLTRDVDLKVGASRADVDRLLNVLAPSFQPAHPEAIAFARKSGVLFLESAEGIRLDLLLAEAGFDELALERGVVAELRPGLKARLCSPEDLILYKLISTRPRDRQDAETISRRQGDALDDEYVEEILRQFEVALDDSTLLETYREIRAKPRPERL